MPQLSDLTRRKLRYLPTAGNAPLNNGMLACWNWALTGFGPGPINPDSIFNYVAGNAQVVVVLPGIITGTAALMNRLDDLRGEWGLIAANDAYDDQTRTDFRGIQTGMLRLAAQMNGLTPSEGQTAYQLCMYYSEGIHGGTHLLIPPNWTHWWLKIDGGGANNDGIESFPGTAFITIRRPEYSQHHVSRIYLRELHASHVTNIDAAVAHLITTNHALVAHGAWQADNTRTRCTICGTLFSTFTRKHHCRCCGRIICAACSPGTRQLAHPLAHPTWGAGNGPWRVCLYC